MLEQLSKNPNQDKLQEMFLVLSALPEKIEASLLSSQNKLHNSFIKEVQVCMSIMESTVATASILDIKIMNY